MPPVRGLRQRTSMSPVVSRPAMIRRSASVKIVEAIFASVETSLEAFDLVHQRCDDLCLVLVLALQTVYLPLKPLSLKGVDL